MFSYQPLNGLKVFNACLLSLLILTVPVAPLTATPNRGPIGRTTPNTKSERKLTPQNRLESSLLINPLSPVAAPSITTTLRDAFIDTNSSGRADPGSAVTYTANISNTGNADATGVVFTDTPDPNTTLVNGSVRISPLAFADSYSATKNTVLNVSAPGVLTNDTGTPVPTAVAITNGPTTGGGTVTLNTDGSFAYTPLNNFTGADTFTYTATNGQLPNDSATVTITVTGGPQITSANNATFTVGQAGTFTVTTSGSPTATTITKTGSLPSNVTFTNNGDGTATIAGTAAAGTGGTYPITITASNGVPTDAMQNFTLTVNQAPAITSANNTTFTVGSPGTFAVTTTGFPAPSIARGGVALPSGVNFVDNGNGTGTLSGTPGAGTGGTYAITFTATNAAGSTPAQNFTLTIRQAPAITSANNTTFTVGSLGTFTVTTTGFPTPSIARGGVALPSGVNFVDNGDGTGTLSGTPGAGTGGTYAITFTATNVVGSTPAQNFTLNINQAPTITSANNTTFTVGSPGTFTVTTTGFPAPSIARGGVALPSGVNFVDNGNGTGTLSGTPGAGTGGTYAITFTATNAAGSTPAQNFTLTIRQAPAITSANSTTFTVGSLGTFTVTTTGFPTPSIARGGVALPSGVNFVDNGDGTGTLSGTPGAGTGGTYAITFTATNVVGSTPAQNFTLTVNQAPAFTSANTTTFAPGKTGQIFNVTATGFPNNALLVFSATGTFPTGVSLTDNGNGTAKISGTPAAGTQAGSPYNTIVLKASNGVSPDATQNFTLNIVCPVITVSGTTPLNLTHNVAMGTSTYTQSGGNGTITWSATGLPTGVSINSATGDVTGTPTVTGTFSAVITATDAGACTGTKNITVSVGPNLQTQSYTGVGNTQFFITGVAGAPTTPAVSSANGLLTSATPGGNVTIIGASCSTGGTLTAVDSSGHFIFTPNVSATSATCTYTASSNTGPGSTGPASTTANLTFTLNNMVWYVNSSGSNGDGRSHSPFNNMNNADTSSGANEYVFVHTGAATTTGSISLAAGQTLWGQGSTFALGPLTIASGTKPTLTGTVTLGGNNDTVSSLDISTGSSTGLTNTGTITGALVENSVTVTTSTGTAVSLSNTGGTLSFTSISANGAANGISLTNTTGSFTVTGDGSNTNNSSGGTIQNSTNNGITLSNAQNISLTSMNIQSSGHSGIYGSNNVQNFSFVKGTINNSGTSSGSGDSNIAFSAGEFSGSTGTNKNISGTLTITGSTLTNAFYSGLDVYQFDGTISNANISNNTLTSSTNIALSKSTAILLSCIGSASTVSSITKGTINSNVITNFPSNAGIFVTGGNATSTGAPAGTYGADATTNIISINSNTITGQASPNQMGTQGIVVTLNGRGTGFFSANSNSITNVKGNGIQPSAFGLTTLTMFVIGNTINAHNQAASQGIGAGTGNTFAASDTPTLNIKIGDGTVGGSNNISNTDGNGILIVARSASGHVNARVLKNTVTTPIESPPSGTTYGIRVDAGNLPSVDDAVCLEISANTTSGNDDGAGTHAPGIGLRKQGTSSTVNDFGIVGMAATSSPGVENYVNGLNPGSASGSFGVGGTALISATSGFSNCTEPAVLALARPETKNERDYLARATFRDLFVSKDAIAPGHRAHRPAITETSETANTGRITPPKAVEASQASTHISVQPKAKPSADRTLSHHARGNAKARLATAMTPAAPPPPSVNASIGTLPAGKNVTLTFQVTLNNAMPSGTSQVSTQGTVSYTDSANNLYAPVSTDDPDTGAPNDPTVTPVDAPTAADGSVGGQIIDNNGHPVEGAAIRMNGTQNRLTITDAQGNYHFDSVETNGFYSVIPSRANYNFSPQQRSFSQLGNHTDAVFTATSTGCATNPLDTTEYFVRQQYLDFLGREPEEGGLTGWVNTINNCAAGDTSCDRVHVSEAFFRSAEFQERGYFIYRFYTAAFGHKPDYAEFKPDMARVSGFLTNDQLEAAKTAFVNDFISRPAFASQYNSLNSIAYVDALINTAGVNLSNRQTLIDSLNNGTQTRAQVLRQIAESGEVYQKYYNQAFVVMEYFGYLHRDPDALYLNWIDVLNQGGDSRHMVSGFVNSTEYRNRFVSSGNCSNPLDATEYFVRQNYLDFLGREPDESGLSFWVNNIESCGADQNCREAKRIDTSAAFFLSIEFQQTGYLVYRMYQVAYGNLPGAPVPIKLSEFTPDTAEIGNGVVVLQSGWEQKLENNKQAFAAEFVQRSRFTAAYPATMTPEQFIDKLFANAGVTPTATDRTAAINDFGSSPTISDAAARARALRRVAENSAVTQQNFNQAFVLMEYYGYLRRNPSDTPEQTLDFAGYNFWLTKLNNFNGNFQDAEMVKAFLVSSEYRQRFPR